MSDRANEIKRQIIQFLNGRQQSAFTKEIAHSLGLAQPTVSKYLEVLYAEGHLEKDDEKKPYVFWKSKENGIQESMKITER
jgi:Mn-dependent DtxR family transcriptional regulator